MSDLSALSAWSSPPAAAEPLIEDEDEALPPAALEPLEEVSEGSEEGEDAPPADALPPVVDDWLVCAPWFIEDEEFTSVDDWFAETLEFVVLLPLPTFTPGLMFAPALTSVLPMPTFAPTPTFGLTLTLLSVLLCAKAEPNAPMTAAAVILTARCLTLMCSVSFRVGDTRYLRKPCATEAATSVGRIPTMSEHKRPHDMGGDEDGGAIDTADHGMKFWEKQANALRNTLTSRKLLRLDELRRAAEDLGERYYQLEYFERTTHALRQVLLEKGYFTEAELAAKMKEVRQRYEG